MKSRFVIVALSLLLAILATLGAAFYIAQLRASVTEGQRLVEVMVTKSAAKAGTSASELLATGAIEVAKIPKQYVADGAIKSIEGYSDRILASDLAKGTQLTEASFKKKDETALSYKVKNGMVAVSISVDDNNGVGGRLQTGDKVDVFSTFSPGPNNEDMTKIMLQNIEVLATPDSGSGDKGSGFMKSQQTSTGKKTVTLAVVPDQAEKLVFAAEKGHIWLALRHVGNGDVASTPGRTVKSIFE